MRIRIRDRFFRLRWPLFKHECYECPGAWAFRWPLDTWKYDPRAAERERELLRFVTDAFKMQAVAISQKVTVARWSEQVWGSTISIPLFDSTRANEEPEA